MGTIYRGSFPRSSYTDLRDTQRRCLNHVCVTATTTGHTEIYNRKSEGDDARILQIKPSQSSIGQ
eukprot:578393-Ditylum_brightwellii.AAC.1